MVSFVLLVFGLSMIYVSLTSRHTVYIKIVALQGFLLFLLVLFDVRQIPKAEFIVLTFETLVFKALVLPLLLSRIVRKNNALRGSEPFIPHFYSVLITTLIVIASFVVAYWAEGRGVKPFFFGMAVSTIACSLFIIMTRRSILKHVMGFVMLENGIFLISLSAEVEMPLIVTLGTLLDVFIAVFILGLFVKRVQEAFEDTGIDKLTGLKD
jgi:hydrogenase-4 component E